MGIKEKEDGKSEFTPHPEWIKNHSMAEKYISVFPQELLYIPFSSKELMFSIAVEGRFIAGYDIPFLFWVTTHKSDYGSRAYPLSLHIPHHEFVDKVRKHFPFPKLLEKGIEYKQTDWWNKN